MEREYNESLGFETPVWSDEERERAERAAMRARETVLSGVHDTSTEMNHGVEMTTDSTEFTIAVFWPDESARYGYAVNMDIETREFTIWNSGIGEVAGFESAKDVAEYVNTELQK